jgi:aldehyde dehydrogenase (NAD+)
VVWINCTNVLDAGAGFGGYRESGFGREGAREGMRAYLKTPAPQGTAAELSDLSAVPHGGGVADAVDRTAKLYIGGKQARPDSGYAYTVEGASGPLGLAGLGNRKDIRNAVEAASKAGGWGKATGHNRAQVIYYLGENISARADAFVARLESFGLKSAAAKAEVETAIRRCFWYAAQADKFDGAVHQTKSAHITLAMHEPLGIMGLVCPTGQPLLGALSLVLPAIAMGNSVVAVPSQTHPLAATDLYQVLETSDVPAGVVNIVTGPRDELARTLAQHDGVSGMWYVGGAESAAMVEAESAGNLKQTWTEIDGARDWSGREGQGRAFLHRATQVKNIWLPYGE